MGPRPVGPYRALYIGLYWAPKGPVRPTIRPKEGPQGPYRPNIRAICPVQGQITPVEANFPLQGKI